MKNYYLLLFAFYFLLPVFSQSVESDSTGLLWEITGKKVKSPSYLFGTIHLISADKFYFPDALEPIITDSELIVMEIGELSEQMEAVQFLMLEEGDLFDHFSAEQEDSLLIFVDNQLNIAKDQSKLMFGRMKPMALMQLFAQAYFDEQPKSYEMKINELAQKHNVKVEGLETVEEQIALFDAIPMDEQVEMLMESVRDFEKQKEQFKEMETAYLSQDLKKLQDVLHSDSNHLIMQHESNILINRNKNWIPKIKRLMKKNKTFIAVGAGHLQGEDGLIQLLKDEGYELKPIRL